MKKWGSLGLFLFLVLGFGRVALAAEAEATYVGNEACKACHAPQFEKFSKTMMGKIFLFNPRNNLERQACESCHGPASNHVAAGGGRGVGGLISFRKGAGESAEAQNERCLQCHERGDRAYWRAGPHAGRGLTCTNCHTLMEKTTNRSQLAKVDDKTPFGAKRAQIEVCSQCHLQRKAQLLRSSHMPLREGKLTCTSCHNPHGTPNPSMLIQASVNENCYSCHAERRGPFLHEHPPVSDNCGNCHEPHGAVNDRLLKVRIPRLCTRCHSGHRTNDPADRRGFFNRGCPNCHSQIHGSNHPGGMFFQR